MGLISDKVGEMWEKGAGGLKNINVESARIVYPVWTVKGPCTNPKLQNDTTDSEATYQGTVAEGQTLTVDFAAETAHLDTALVTRYLVGSVTLAPGNNVVGFSSDGGDQKQSTLSWNNIIG